MEMKDVYAAIRHAFQETVDMRNIGEKALTISAPGYEGGAGEDLHGAEAKIIAFYEGVQGECSTSYPASFTGTLAEVLRLDMDNNPHERSLYIAALNAVMNKYELADDCLTCLDSDKDRCAEHILRQYKKNNGKVNFLLAGYQPHMAKALAEHFPLRLLDLNPENIGKTVFGVTIEDGAAAYADATRWAEVVLCTGSALANGTIFDYIKLPKDVSFYGTTIAGAARILGIRRVCPFGRN